MPAAKRKATKPSRKSELEEGFLRLWKLLAKGQPEPVREYVFAPPRKYRFDFAWPRGPNESGGVAVEMEGGIFTGGAHGRALHFHSDCSKYNLAITNGWRVLRFTRLHLDESPVQMIELVVDVLESTP